MPQFAAALSFVHETLTRMREGGSGLPPRAALATLEGLAKSVRGAGPVRGSATVPVNLAAPRRQTAAESAVAPPVERSGRLGLAARALAAMAASKSLSPEPPEPPPARVLPVAPAPAIPDLPASPSPLPSPIASKPERMERLRERALVCIKCPHLAASRTQVVFGVGHVDAEVMFVGEAPGADEDLQGEPFVGKAGQLLTKIIEAMGFRREDVYIANILKCRPDMPPGESGNRKPRPGEMATCLPYLIEQIEIVRPKCLVALGATAMQGLVAAEAPIGQARGHWHAFEGIPLMATYHPAYLVRNQSNTEKRKVWEDMLQVLERLGKPISERQRAFFLNKH